MFDANEEQLLTDLLREIGEADRLIEPPPGFESRMMARLDTRASQSHSQRNYWRMGAFAAAVAAIIATVALGQRTPSRPTNERPPLDSHPMITATDHSNPTDALVSGAHELPPVVRRERRARPAALETARRASPQSTRVVDFIPLAPMTPDDFSRSLQIVPIRIGETPADLLLGEDGTAKAIRVSSSSDAHVFWRPR